MNRTIVVLALLAGSLGLATKAQAYFLSAGGTSVAGEGQYSSVAGATTFNFNDGLLPGFYSSGAVVSGSSGTTAAPPGDTSSYLNVGATYGDNSAITFGAYLSYFGFYYGSPDDYNVLRLYRDNVLLKTYTGNELGALIAYDPAHGDRSQGLFANIFAESTDEYFNKIVFSSSGRDAFETDNHAILAVPEPGALPLVVLAFGLAGLMTRRHPLA